MQHKLHCNRSSKRGFFSAQSERTALNVCAMDKAEDVKGGGVSVDRSSE